MFRPGATYLQLYTDVNLEKTVDAVKSDIMLIRKACDAFKVPKITVLNRVNGNVIDSGDGIKAYQRPVVTG